MNVSLTPELEKMIHKKVETGLYLSASEVVREALRLLQDAQNTTDTWLGRLLRARAYLQADAFAEANTELDTCMRRRGEAVGCSAGACVARCVDSAVICSRLFLFTFQTS